jgi:hypothetical protein
MFSRSQAISFSESMASSMLMVTIENLISFSSFDLPSKLEGIAPRRGGMKDS